MRKRESGREQRTTSGPLTRRVALYALGAAGGMLAAAYLAPSAGTAASGDAAAATIQAETTTFTVTTTTADGVTIRATAKPKQLAFIVEGPIRPEKPIRLVVVPKESEALTQEQEQQKEAALKLLEVSGHFATPQAVWLHKWAERDFLIVSFYFLGVKDRERRIGLAATVKDKDGRVLVNLQRNCKDRRIPPEEPTRIGRTLRPLPWNREEFEIRSDVFDSVHRIEITLLDGALPGDTAASEDPVAAATETETPTFSLTTTTADGVTIRATAKPKQLAFIVEGPIRPEKSIPLVAAPTNSEALTKEQKQQKEAALKLLHVSGDFMTPLKIVLLKEPTGGSGTAYASFMFLGEKDPERVIGLTFTLKDQDGKELATGRRDYRDARAFPTVEIITGGERQSVLTGINAGGVRIERDLVDEVHCIDLTFIDGGLPEAEKK